MAEVAEVSGVVVVTEVAAVTEVAVVAAEVAVVAARLTSGCSIPWDRSCIASMR
jgi:hypothetical protein